MGKRKVPFSKVLYIEKDDFMEDPPKKYFRLAPGKEVRLRYAYYITCIDYIKDENGGICEVHCTYDPETRGGQSPDGRKVRGTIHWVSADNSIKAEVRLYDRLFKIPNPSKIKDEDEFLNALNNDSLEVLKDCRLEPSLKDAKSGVNYQFERLGYFVIDYNNTDDQQLVFNRTVTLRDSWAKLSEKVSE